MVRPHGERSSKGDAILIAAQSGRALALAARRAGYRPFVLDLFGDADTLDLVEHHRRAAGRFGSGLMGGEAVIAALDELAALAGGTPLGIVLGSGFEGSPELMARVAGRYRLIGATPETVAILKAPMGFAALCTRLSIPHPAVTLDAVADPAAWLLKRAGGSGGSHIRAATPGRAPRGAYFQKRVPGRPHAIGFLADGRGMAVRGTTEQWSAPSPVRPFRYAGALERASHEAPALAPATLAGIADAVARLVEATGLRGLASADILVDGGEWWLTEINPRPGATLDVLDRRPTPLLAQHIAASLGRLDAIEASPMDAAATEICYAAAGFARLPPIDWPDFVRDRPQVGASVARDAPLCTLFATGPDAAAAQETLRERALVMRALLERDGGNR